jgi:hypothetical protein
MKYGTGEFDVAKMSGTLSHSLATSRALEIAIYCTHSGISQTTFFLFLLFIKNFGEFDFSNGISFLEFESAFGADFSSGDQT